MCELNYSRSYWNYWAGFIFELVSWERNLFIFVHQHEGGGVDDGVTKTGGKSNLIVKHNEKIVFYFVVRVDY